MAKQAPKRIVSSTLNKEGEFKTTVIEGAPVQRAVVEAKKRMADRRVGTESRRTQKTRQTMTQAATPEKTTQGTLGRQKSNRRKKGSERRGSVGASGLNQTQRDARIKELEGLTKTPKVAPATKPASSTVNPQELYNAARAALKSGKASEAKKALEGLKVLGGTKKAKKFSAKLEAVGGKSAIRGGAGSLPPKSDLQKKLEAARAENEKLKGKKAGGSQKQRDRKSVRERLKSQRDLQRDLEAARKQSAGAKKPAILDARGDSYRRGVTRTAGTTGRRAGEGAVEPKTSAKSVEVKGTTPVTEEKIQKARNKFYRARDKKYRDQRETAPGRIQGVTTKPGTPEQEIESARGLAHKRSVAERLGLELEIAEVHDQVKFKKEDTAKLTGKAETAAKTLGTTEAEVSRVAKKIPTPDFGATEAEIAAVGKQSDALKPKSSLESRLKRAKGLGEAPSEVKDLVNQIDEAEGRTKPTTILRREGKVVRTGAKPITDFKAAVAQHEKLISRKSVGGKIRMGEDLASEEAKLELAHKFNMRGNTAALAEMERKDKLRASIEKRIQVLTKKIARRERGIVSSVGHELRKTEKYVKKPQNLPPLSEETVERRAQFVVEQKAGMGPGFKAHLPETKIGGKKARPGLGDIERESPASMKAEASRRSRRFAHIRGGLEAERYSGKVPDLTAETVMGPGRGLSLRKGRPGYKPPETVTKPFTGFGKKLKRMYNFAKTALKSPAIGAQVGENIRDATQAKARRARIGAGGAGIGIVVLSGVFGAAEGARAASLEKDPKKKLQAAKDAALEGAIETGVNVGVYTGVTKLATGATKSFLKTGLPLISLPIIGHDIGSFVGKEVGKIQDARRVARENKIAMEADYGTIERATATRKARKAIRTLEDASEYQAKREIRKQKVRDLLTGK